MHTHRVVTSFPPDPTEDSAPVSRRVRASTADATGRARGGALARVVVPGLVAAGAIALVVAIVVALGGVHAGTGVGSGDLPAAGGSPGSPVAGSAGAGFSSPPTPSASTSVGPTSSPSSAPAAALPPSGTSIVSVPSPFASCAAGLPGSPPNAPPGGGGTEGPIAQKNSEVEPSIAADPQIPLRIVAAWQQDRWTDGAARAIGIAATDDGGLTWHRSWPAFSACAGGASGADGGYTRVSDPWVAATVDGTFIVTALGVNPATHLSAVLVTRSTDGGMTWATPVAVARDADAAHFNDKEAVTADPKVPGRAWIVWDRTGSSSDPGEAPSPTPGPSHSPLPFSADVMLVGTNDGGRTWSAPAAVFRGAPNQAFVGNQIAVLPDGTLVDTAQLLVDSGLRDARTEIGVLRSMDGGQSWSAPIVAATVPGSDVIDPRTKRPIRAGWAIPAIAADPATGRVYLVWTDGRFAGGGPGIAISSSADDGATWTAPSRVDAGTAGTAAFTPSIGLMSSGAIAVTYDVASSAGAASGPWNTRVVLAVSGDHGSTWQRQPLTAAFDLHRAPTSGGLFLGDYAGLATVARSGDDRVIAVSIVTTARGATNATDVVVSVVRP